MCSTSGGKRINFEWLKNGKNIKDIPHTQVVSISDVSTIIMEPVAESDSGNYTCVANSEGVNDMFVAALNVYGKVVDWNLIKKLPVVCYIFLTVKLSAYF